MGKPVTPGNLSQATAGSSPRQRPHWGHDTARNAMVPSGGHHNQCRPPAPARPHTPRPARRAVMTTAQLQVGRQVRSTTSNTANRVVTDKCARHIPLAVVR